MPADVTMPKLTDSMEEGRIVAWQVAVGDPVHEGDVLAEIETDKAVMELESFWEGTVVELLCGDGDVVAVGEVLARVGEGGAGLAATREEGAATEPERATTEVQGQQPAELNEPEEPEQKGRTEPSAQATRPSAGVPIPGGHPLSERGGVSSPRPQPPLRRPPPAPETGIRATAPGAGVRASPRARRRALELGVALAEVTPTGGDGQVTVEDVEAAAGAGRSGPAASLAPAQPATPPDRADEELPPVTFTAEEAEVEEVSFYQKAVIRRVVASKHVIPCMFSRVVPSQCLGAWQT
ncbi:MAG: E3 binding domain-containing protein, partial [Deferrisomatales bacterium]|nr:E3 binding domain-containing protein [Deferrisomatales bacterium]